MEAVTIAPTAGDTSMLAGGFIRLNGVLIIPAMIFAIGTEKNTPPTKLMTANRNCFHSWCGSDVRTYIAAPASAHSITPGVASGNRDANVTPIVADVTPPAMVRGSDIGGPCVEKAVRHEGYVASEGDCLRPE